MRHKDPIVKIRGMRERIMRTLKLNARERVALEALLKPEVDIQTIDEKRMKKITKLAALLAVLVLTGCNTTNQTAMTHAAFTAAVTLGEQFALEQHPEAVPYVRAAVPVVCGVANGTNVSPQAIVSALEAAGVTDPTTKLIINGSLALFNVVISGIATNQTEVRLYAVDLCNGMTSGLPPEKGAPARKRVLLAPHLK